MSQLEVNLLGEMAANQAQESSSNNDAFEFPFQNDLEINSNSHFDNSYYTPEGAVSDFSISPAFDSPAEHVPKTFDGVPPYASAQLPPNANDQLLPDAYTALSSGAFAQNPLEGLAESPNNVFVSLSANPVIEPPTAPFAPPIAAPASYSVPALSADILIPTAAPPLPKVAPATGFATGNGVFTGVETHALNQLLETHSAAQGIVPHPWISGTPSVSGRAASITLDHKQNKRRRDDNIQSLQEPISSSSTDLMSVFKSNPDPHPDLYENIAASLSGKLERQILGKTVQHWFWQQRVYNKQLKSYRFHGSPDIATCRAEDSRRITSINSDNGQNKRRRVNHIPSLQEPIPSSSTDLISVFKSNPDPHPDLYENIAASLSGKLERQMSGKMVQHWFWQRRVYDQQLNNYRFHENFDIVAPVTEESSSRAEESGYVSAPLEADQGVATKMSQEYMQQQEVSQQDVLQQDLSQQEVSQQEVSQQDISQQDISQQDISQQNLSRQNVYDLQSSELATLGRTRSIQRSGMTCPEPNCSTIVKTRSDWDKHKNVHWPTKFGCLYCYVIPGNGCKICEKKFSTQSLALKHVLECIRNSDSEIKDISRKSGGRGKVGWWQKNNITKNFQLHLDKEHPDIARDEAHSYIRNWSIKVPFPQTETTCKDCKQKFAKWEDFDAHCVSEHYLPGPVLHGFGVGRQSRDNQDSDDDNAGNDGGPDNNPDRRPSRGNGPPRSSAINTQGSSPMTADTTTGQQRPSGPQSTGACQSSTTSHKSAIIEMISSADHQDALNPDSCNQRDFHLRGLGSQFTESSGGWSHMENNESTALTEIVNQPYIYTRSNTVVHLMPLGKGATGVVDSVWDPRRPKGELARKTLQSSSETSLDAILPQIRREIKALARLRHRHIVSLVDWSETSDSMQLLMSPAADDDLRNFLERTGQNGQDSSVSVPREPLMLDRVVAWMSCLSSALAYMHSAGVTHGDIKPQNVLVRGRHAWFGDFGAAEFEWEVTPGLGSASRWATPLYSPPEIRSKAPRGRAADIWSFGCVLLEVSTWLAGYCIQTLRDYRGSAKAKPYHVEFKSTLWWVRALRRRFELTQELRTKTYIIDAVLGMLVIDPEGRATELEVWKRLTPGGCREGECMCETMMLPTADDNLQEDARDCPSGTLLTVKETENDVIAAMRESHDGFAVQTECETTMGKWSVTHETSHIPVTPSAKWLHDPRCKDTVNLVRQQWLWY